MINYNLININKTIKFVLFFTSILLFLILCDITRDLTTILAICAYIAVVYYVLDMYYPNCNIHINQLK